MSDETNLRDEATPPENDSGAGAERADAAPEPASGDAAQGDVEALRQAVVERDRKIELLQRIAADLDNRRKRVERSAADQARYALQDLTLDLLPVIDNFERALAHAEESGDFRALHDGLKLVHDQLLAVLKKYHVEKVEALGEAFDPNRHEAVGQAESAEHAEGTVVEVHQNGYRLHDRVVRPSRVIVSRRPSADGGEAGRPDGGGEDDLAPADDEP